MPEPLDIGLAVAYGAAWPVLPRPWRVLLLALPIVSLVYSAPVGSYAWAVLLLLSMTELVLSLNTVRPGAGAKHVGQGLMNLPGAVLKSFIGIVRRPLERHETGAGGGVPMPLLLTQTALYGSFVVWCLLSFCYFAVEDATAPRMFALGLGLTAGITLFQVPILMMSAAFYTTRTFFVDVTLFPLHWAPILACTSASAALAVQWFDVGSFEFWWTIVALCLVPLGLSIVVWRDTDAWWEARRWAEMTTWLLLAREAMTTAADSTPYVVLAAITLAFGVMYLLFFVLTEMVGKFMPLAGKQVVVSV